MSLKLSPSLEGVGYSMFEKSIILCIITTNSLRFCNIHNKTIAILNYLSTEVDTAASDVFLRYSEP